MSWSAKIHIFLKKAVHFQKKIVFLRNKTLTEGKSKMKRYLLALLVLMPGPMAIAQTIQRDTLVTPVRVGY